MLWSWEDFAVWACTLCDLEQELLSDHEAWCLAEHGCGQPVAHGPWGSGRWKRWATAG